MRFILVTATILLTVGCGQAENYSCDELREMICPEAPIITTKDAIGYAIHINEKFLSTIHYFTFDHWKVEVSQEKEIWTVHIISKAMLCFEGKFQFDKNGVVLYEHVKRPNK